MLTSIFTYNHDISTGDFTSDSIQSNGFPVAVQLLITSLGGTLTSSYINIEGSIDGTNFYNLKSTVLTASDAGKNPVYVIPDTPGLLFIRVKFIKGGAATGTITNVLFIH